MRRGRAPHFAMLLSLDSTGQTLGGAVSRFANLRKISSKTGTCPALDVFRFTACMPLAPPRIVVTSTATTSFELRAGEEPSTASKAHQAGLSAEDTHAEPDAIQELLDRLEHGGFGDVVRSWIGPGRNKSIDPAHVDATLGPHVAGALARQRHTSGNSRARACAIAPVSHRSADTGGEADRHDAAANSGQTITRRTPGDRSCWH